MAAVKALQQWCKIQCEGYRDVEITNMTTSFRDGLAFCALIHKHRPDLIDFDSLSKENVYENNHLAFRVAEEELGIPALLDAEDMVALRVPDRLSILTYVSQYYNYFHGRSPIGGMAGIKRLAEEPVGELSGKKNQPVAAKVFASPKTDTENKREILAERSNKSATISSNCSVCNKHVHLVQRHLVDGKLYHRNCFKCSECSNILLSGTYKPGKEPNTFICKSHQNAQKPPVVKVTDVTPTLRATQNTPGFRTPTLTSSSTSTLTPASNSTLNNQKSPFSAAGFKHTPLQSNPNSHWTAGKIDSSSSSTPTPAPRSKAAASRSGLVTVMMNPTSDCKVTTESPKLQSSCALKNQAARKRFFEAGSGPGSSTSITTSSSANGSASSAIGVAGAARGAAKGRVLLQAGDFAKEKENEKEKEKAKSVISKMVTEQSNKSSNSSSSPTWRSSLLTTTTSSSSNSSVSSVDMTSSKSPSGRVRLKPLEPVLEKNAAQNWTRTKEKEPVRTGAMLPTANKDAQTAPSDWRSLLKPIAKDAKPGSSSSLTPSSSGISSPEPVTRPWASSAGNSQALRPTPVTSPSSSGSLPSITPLRNGTEPSGAGRGNDMKGGESGSRDPASPSHTRTTHQIKAGYIPSEEILRELKEIEVNLDELEQKGVELEKQLRSCEEEGHEDVLSNDLMVEWFNLIRNKQVYIRRESELVYIARTQDLEEEQPNVEAELRKLMEKPENLKTPRDRRREKELMEKLLEIVNDRNAIVEGLDEDRLREEEEDEQLNLMMQKLDTKPGKKKKSPISKFFGWKKSVAN